MAWQGSWSAADGCCVFCRVVTVKVGSLRVSPSLHTHTVTSAYRKATGLFRLC